MGALPSAGTVHSTQDTGPHASRRSQGGRDTPSRQGDGLGVQKSALKEDSNTHGVAGLQYRATLKLWRAAQACSMLAIQPYDPVHCLLITHIQEYRRRRNAVTKTPQGVNVITQIY